MLFVAIFINVWEVFWFSIISVSSSPGKSITIYLFYWLQLKTKQKPQKQ